MKMKKAGSSTPQIASWQDNGNGTCGGCSVIMLHELRTTIGIIHPFFILMIVIQKDKTIQKIRRPEKCRLTLLIPYLRFLDPEHLLLPNGIISLSIGCSNILCGMRTLYGMILKVKI